jgi:hypothetical protein
MTLVIIRNSKRTTCSNCGGVHEHITRPTQNRPCFTPVAYEEDVAKKTARMLAHGEQDIERIPTGTDVVLAEGARQLPVRGEPELQRFTISERWA